MEPIASRIYRPGDFSACQWQEVLVTLGKKGFSPEMATELANAKSGKAEQVVQLFRMSYPSPAEDWQSLYEKFFGEQYDFSEVNVPAHQSGFDRVIIVARGMTQNKVFEAMQKHFQCWRYTDNLDKATHGLNEREPAEHYAIRVRNRIEADEELKNLSANQIKGRGLTTETLLERELHGLKVFAETGEHLDVDNITLCAGSRDSHGDVPDVDWGRMDRKVSIDWYVPRFADDYLRARAVVS